MLDEIDRTDMAILYHLQDDARNNTTTSIAEQVDVSSTTVGTRIRKLEENGIIEGYTPTVDYEKAGFEYHSVVVCTVPFEEVRSYVNDVIENVSGAIYVRAFLATERNLSVEVVGINRKEFERSLHELIAVGVSIERFELVTEEERRPLDIFGKQFTFDS